VPLFPEDVVTRSLQRVTLVALLSLCGSLPGLIPTADAQAFPDHFLKMIVPFPPGGATDVLGRLLAKKMSDLLGQPFVVENHGGAGGTIGTDFAARQPPDGYTVVLVSALAQAASKKLYPAIKYDPVKSFTPIGSLGALSYVLVVNPNLGITSLDGLVKAMKADPGKFNYASAGVGSAPHLAMELFLRAADVRATHVPYQGSAPALTGVVAGDTQLAIDNVAAVPLIKSGKLRALAQTGKARSAHLSDVPTFAEAGLPQFDITATWGLLAPAGVPAPIVAKLNDALVRAVNDPQLRESLNAQGITPEPGSAQQFGAVLASETERLSKLIDDAKIQP
jgi:tripartite-type tricarboxylate transporter receptor subunit TctC